MSTKHDRDTIMPLYEKPAGQPRPSPLRRFMYLWRTKPLVRWVVLTFIVTFTFMATYKMRKRSIPEPAPVPEETKDATKKGSKRPAGKVFHWDSCPDLITELDEARGPDFRHPHPESNLNQTDLPDESEWARELSALDLIAMAKRGEKLPQNIIHQSWKRRTLPKDFERWSKDWKRIHGKDWVYVLWVDSDNRALMKAFYPQYLETYDALPKEIYRADMVRNAYMHRFGGVYADLDLIPLTSMQHRLPIFNRDRSNDPLSVVYLGHMGSRQDKERWGNQDREQKKLDKAKGIGAKKYEDDDEDDEDDWDTFEHSIPNAFMIATKAGHPLWLQALDYVKHHLQFVKLEDDEEEEETSTDTNSDHHNATKTEEEEKKQKEVIQLYEPEKLTGPVALKRCVKNFNKLRSRRNREAKGIFDQVVVLPDSKIYPFSWYDESNLEQCLCRRHSPHLDEKKCNSLYPDAWAITYWTHSWE